MQTGYKSLLNEVNYLKNLLSSIVNRFGDSIDMLAFSWLIFQITGSAQWTAVMFGVNMLPTVIFTPFTGVLVERMNKKNVMIAADLARAVLVSILIALYMTDLLTPYFMLLITFLMSVAEAFRLPASMPLIAQIVPKEKYGLATGLSSSLQSLAEIAGVGIAGLIIGLGGVAAAMLIDVATFIVSAVIMLTVRLSADTPAEAPADETKELPKPGFRTLITDFKEGIRYIVGVKLFTLLLLLMCIINLMLVPLNALFTPYLVDTLGLPAMGLSVAHISLTFGISIGAFLYPRLESRFSRTTLFIAGGILFSFDYLGLVAISYLPGTWEKYLGLALCHFLCCIGIAQLSMVARVSFMERVDPQYMSRLFGVQMASSTATMPVGAFVIAGISGFVSSKTIFIVFAVLSIIFYAILSRNKLFKEINTSPEALSA